MSVQETTYVVIGVKLPDDYFNEEERDALSYSPYSDNVHRKDIGNKDGLTVIHDGKLGGYTVIGQVLVKARHHEGDGVPFTELDIGDGTRQAIAAKLAEHFQIVAADVQPMVFTHYS